MLERETFSLIPHRCVWCGENTACRKLLVPVLNRNYPFDQRTGALSETRADVIFNRIVWVCGRCTFRLVRLQVDYGQVRTDGMRFSGLVERDAEKTMRRIDSTTGGDSHQPQGRKGRPLLTLDETKYWSIGNPEDVCAGDTVITVSGNQYEAQPINGAADTILCLNPDADMPAFQLPYDRFDYALRCKPSSVQPGMRLDEWKPNRRIVCPQCRHDDQWRNAGVRYATRLHRCWHITWKCSCGYRLVSFLEAPEKDSEHQDQPPLKADVEKPEADDDPTRPECGPRVVRLPQVRSFGRMTNKWLLVKTLEEAAELMEAGKRVINAPDFAAGLDARAGMLAEWADVLQTLVNTAVAFDLTDEEISRAMNACFERNRERGRVQDLPEYGK